MFKLISILFPLLLFAAQAHIHGTSQAQIVKENNQLQIQWIIAAHDFFGFEHYDKSKKQELIIHKKIQSLESHKNFIISNCEFIKSSNNISEWKIKNYINGNKNHHSDIILSFIYKCIKDEAEIEFTGLNEIKSINKLEASIVSNNTQKSEIITKLKNKIKVI